MQSFRKSLLDTLPALRAFARFLTRNASQADDLVQETVMRALTAHDQFIEGTSIKAWLFTIARNLFYETRRRHRRESEVMEDFSAQAALNGDDGQAPLTDTRARVHELEREIWKLPPPLREALILVGAQEMTYEEAAAVCGVPVGTVKARVSRARSHLGRQLSSDEAADAGTDGGGEA